GCGVDGRLVQRAKVGIRLRAVEIGVDAMADAATLRLVEPAALLHDVALEPPEAGVVVVEDPDGPRAPAVVDEAAVQDPLIRQPAPAGADALVFDLGPPFREPRPHVLERLHAEDRAPRARERRVVADRDLAGRE